MQIIDDAYILMYIAAFVIIWNIEANRPSIYLGHAISAICIY